jgi:coenzyme A diphosphatase NUDT7
MNHDTLGMVVDMLEHLRGRLRDQAPGTAVEIEAAVVVPLRRGPRGMEVLFEQRPLHMSQSPGEVSFPGGRVEPGEAPLEAALRELEEELGVPPERVEVLGRLRTRQRRRGEFIHPFVCTLDPGAQILPQAAEVEEVFAVRIEELITGEFGEARIVEEYTLSEEFPTAKLPGGRWGGRQERPVHFFAHGPHFIWGLTAAILLELLDLLRSE